jgi:glycosyltransferase involved in cell wall biosynthesis
VCCPIYHGGGTRVKIIEAAAQAKAIVSTHLGAEGLSFEAGREIVLHDDPVAIATACAQLLDDPLAATRIGQAARRKAASNYERSAVVAQLESSFRTGADAAHPRVSA